MTTHNFNSIGVILLSFLFAASIVTATEGVNTNRAWLKYTKHVNKKEKGRTAKNPKASKGNKKSKKLDKIVENQKTDHENQKTDQVPIHCQLPRETGRCKAYYKRWFFNTASQKCEPFVYGGCEGNKNNFLTEKECSISCDRKIEDDCLLSGETGRCKANIQRWFFNTASQKCETFVYGGCERNKNNFQTEKECSISCDRKI